ncbi:MULTISPECIES: glucosamine inositolphosphorylceramide transferase family protein [Sphingomonas]|uniref:glucosamine inositolphosphorylceramide transferase family protein n=1 Tax=Sphingomonas TaxID=13687 RepID=UPI000DF00AD5|nr:MULTISPECIES: hypothetical protein [Sphingomonas]
MIRVGVLREQGDLAAWQLACLRQAQSLDFVDIALFIVNAKQAPVSQGIVARAAKLLKSGSLLWRILDRLVSRRTPAVRGLPLPEILGNVSQVHCTPVPVGKFRETLSDADIGLIADFDLDVVVRFGFGILTGKALEIGRYGVWSYHHGDPDFFRGAPPGFWEIHAGADNTGAILQRLTEKLDGGVILNRAYFKTIAASYSRQLDHLLMSSSPMLARALVQLRNDPSVADARAGTPPPSGPIYRYPKNAAVIRFVWRLVWSWLAEQWTSLFRHQQWGVGFIDASPGDVAEQARGADFVEKDVRWSPEPAGAFLADPFLLRGGADPIVFAEEYDWDSGKGHISTITGHGGVDVRPALKTLSHLSYPFLFEHGGETRCLPENAESGHTTVYATGEQTLTPIGRLKLDFPAVDATILQRDDLWWLFCTRAGPNDKDTLYAFYARDLDSTWTAHDLNPVKIDVRSSRPAGSFIQHGSLLLRPAQDCSRFYGGALVFNQVTSLNPSIYEERAIGRLVPDPAGPYPHGLHTISGTADLTVIDGARHTFVFAQLRRAMLRKLRISRR